ncbi:phytoene/squalene synthase family protein [Antarcticibacterium sp. 1MA-6-2]|uniref:phytoene/squalene synthase family protein n=1 Tax=Antarcticibacterium sp. 1MA-6-2 TaxID=2908210 RepID=UPI001F46AE33|nr:phytoene/squalene synthase family protein [Antarcticibacterium sp. 1MA-6-2]UJH91152.1 phytoene/squalene synthase family protein [Antarcticibacterium sp. 1MA-6-2]
MKSIFDTVSGTCSKAVTHAYSTSFSLATKMLAPSIRQDIYNIYGFVRLADEIVDSFHEFDKETLLEEFTEDLYKAIENKISLNPILNSFQETVHRYGIEKSLYCAFLKSMKMDLYKSTYLTTKEYKEYIYGSADVVGLMCLRVFVKGDQTKYNELRESAMSLGSAFQKVNFLRDLKDDLEDLNRSYFPGTNLHSLDELNKQRIIAEIEADFEAGLKGISKLPVEAKFGVYTAYVYYSKLLKKLKDVPSLEIKSRRISVPNYQKAGLLARSYIFCRLNLL